MIPFAFALMMGAGLAKPQGATRPAAPAVRLFRKDVQVYPTPNRQGSLTVQSGSKASVLFFLFNLDGKLVYQSRLQNQAPQTVHDLAPGTYTYHAFVADRQIRGGQVKLKD